MRKGIDLSLKKVSISINYGINQGFTSVRLSSILYCHQSLVDMIQAELKSVYENYSEPAEIENGDEREATA